MDEIWKPIPDTDYAVSNTGKVASMKKGWRVLAATKGGKGYPQIRIHTPGYVRQTTVHILEAEAFLGPRPTPGHEVNHKDGNKANNLIDNLEWVTASENNHHRFDVLGHHNARGERNWNSKLNIELVREIRRRRAAGESYTSIAKTLSVSRPAVSKADKGGCWGWVV